MSQNIHHANCMYVIEVTHVLAPYKMTKTLKNIQTKFLSKMLGMSRFISGIFLRLRMFWPHTKWPKHLKKFSDKIFVKSAQNVEIYLWNVFKVTHVLAPYKMDKTLVKISKKDLCRKCSDFQDLSVEFF